MRLLFENAMKNHSTKNAVLEKIATEAKMTTFFSDMRIFCFQLIQHKLVRSFRSQQKDTFVISF